MTLRRSLIYYAAEAALAALILASLPPLRDTPLEVPIDYRKDGLFFTALVKTVSESGPFRAPRIGAPFGADIVDWPIGMWLPFGVMGMVERATGEPGLAMNLYWLGTILVASVGATYALRRLRVQPGLALVLGLLYGFQPYAFYRNVGHLNLAFPLVPLLALLCLRVAGARPEDETRAERAVTLGACAAQGFCYVYYSFFACILLAAAIPLGWLRTRSSRLARRGLVAILVLAAGTATTILPSALYWKRHGPNPELAYKVPAETDLFGLKLRHLIVPITDHPVAPLRAIAVKVERAGFAGDNENVQSKLGTVGTIGFLALLGFVLGRAAGLIPVRDDDLDAAAALTLVSLLVSFVGGFASLFSVFVSPDIRAYNRIVVFIDMFCLVAVAALISRLAIRLGGRVRPIVRRAALAALLVCGVLDQVPLGHLEDVRAGSGREFAEDRAFVQAVEARLPPGAMVFQLPHATIPVDNTTRAPMLIYDPGRAYVHSRRLWWSWGSILGRHDDWQTAAGLLPPRELVPLLAVTGFSGLWVDRFGYPGNGHHASLEADLATISGGVPQVSANGRYSFFSLEAYRRRLEEEAGHGRIAERRSQLLGSLPLVRWREGCSEERPAADGWWRSCGSTALMVLRNPIDRELAVRLTARLRSGDSAPRRLHLSAARFEETLDLGRQAVAWEREVVLSAPGRFGLRFDFEGSSPCPGDAAHPGCFEIDVQLRTRVLPRRRTADDDAPSEEGER